MSKIWVAVLASLDQMLEGIFRLFVMLTLAFAIFSWVTRELLHRDPAIQQFGELARGAMVFAGLFGLLLLMKENFVSPADEDL